MSPELHARAREIFLDAYHRTPPDRAALLERECSTDRALELEVRSLLDEHDRLGEFLGRPLEIAPEIPRAAAAPPARIGGYRILRVLGEGGMGTVYLAEQERPRREVALKVIRASAFSARGLRRFEHEAEVLGRLQHPGIAQIYEAGQADCGAGPQPYIAMERVDGSPLGESELVRRLDVHAKLLLLASICDAVHHAHQKGIVHCDLKPSNILVDREGRPKVLDFGIARAADREHVDRTLTLERGALLGTLAYMSPEQALGDAANLDIRTDIHALGAIGYELLSGARPIDAPDAPALEILRKIRDEEPLPLGRRVRALRGDVETIFAKALEKDRERRYASAADLAADLRRFLAGEPIAARPASALYRAQRFAARHRVLVVAATLVLAALITGLVVANSERLHALAAGREANAERLRALAAGREANVERAQAVAAARRATELNQFFERVVTSVDPQRTIAETPFEQTLAEMATEIDARFGSDRVLCARLHGQFGRTLLSHGRDADAEREILAAVVLYRELEGPDAATTLEHSAWLGEMYYRRGDAARARATLEDVLARGRAAFGPDHACVFTAASTLCVLARTSGDLERAKVLGLELLERARRLFGANGSDTLIASHNLALTHLDLGEDESALKLLETVVREGPAVFGEGNATVALARSNLAQVLMRNGRLDEAQAHADAALEQSQRLLGADDHQTALAELQCGRIAHYRGNGARAIEHYARAHAALVAKHGAEHQDALRVQAELALMRFNGDRDPAHAELVQRTFETWSRLYGEASLDAANLFSYVHGIAHERGDVEECLATSRHFVEICAHALPADHELALYARTTCATDLVRSGLDEEGAALAREVLAVATPERAPDCRLGASCVLARIHERRGEPTSAVELLNGAVAECIDLDRVPAAKKIEALDLLVQLALQLRHFDEAYACAERAAELRGQICAPNDANLLRGIATLARVARSQGDLALARAHAEDAYRRSREHHPPASEIVCVAARELGAVLLAEERAPEALPYLLEAVETSRAVFGERNPTHLLALYDQACALHALKRYEEARVLLATLPERMVEAHSGESPSSLRMHALRAWIAMEEGQLDAAAAEFDFAVSGLEGLHLDAASIGATRRGLGVCLGRLGRTAEAAAQLETALGETAAGDRKRHLRVLESLVELYDGAGDAARAAEWRAKLETERAKS